MRITNAQKKQLSEIFEKNALNKFEFETSSEYQIFKIKLKYDYFSFKIEMKNADLFHLTSYPVNRTDGYSVGATWENTKFRFNNWTKEVADELNTPTGWDSFQNASYLNADYSDLNNYFTVDEKVKIQLGIKEVKENVRTLDLSQESIIIIGEKLDELLEKIEDLKKFDWKSLFIGTIANLIMTLSIPSTASGFLWMYIINAFSGFNLIG